MAQQAVERRGLAKHEFVRTGRMLLYGGGKLKTFLSCFFYFLFFYFLFLFLNV